MDSGSVGTLRNSWDFWFHSPVPLTCVREEAWLSQGHTRHVSVSKPKSAPDTTHNTHTKPVWSTVCLNDFYGGYRKSLDKVCFEHSFMSSSSFELLTNALAALQARVFILCSADLPGLAHIIWLPFPCSWCQLPWLAVLKSPLNVSLRCEHFRACRMPLAKWCHMNSSGFHSSERKGSLAACRRGPEYTQWHSTHIRS